MRIYESKWLNLVPNGLGFRCNIITLYTYLNIVYILIFNIYIYYIYIHIKYIHVYKYISHDIDVHGTTLKTKTTAYGESINPKTTISPLISATGTVWISTHRTCPTQQWPAGHNIPQRLPLGGRNGRGNGRLRWSF